MRSPLFSYGIIRIIFGSERSHLSLFFIIYCYIKLNLQLISTKIQQQIAIFIAVNKEKALQIEQILDLVRKKGVSAADLYSEIGNNKGQTLIYFYFPGFFSRSLSRKIIFLFFLSTYS
jgi:hypothetical protein